MSTSHRLFTLSLALCMAFFVLSGCYPQPLKEQSVRGYHSTLALLLPGPVDALSAPMVISKDYEPYVGGQKLYGNEEGGMRIAIYTSTLDAKSLANLPTVTPDEVMHQYLLHTLQLATTAVTAKLNAQDLTFQEEPIMIGSHRALHRGMEFSHEGQAMTADLIAFHTGQDIWIVIVAYNTYEKNKAQMAEKILNSIRLQYEE